MRWYGRRYYRRRRYSGRRYYKRASSTCDNDTLSVLGLILFFPFLLPFFLYKLIRYYNKKHAERKMEKENQYRIQVNTAVDKIIEEQKISTTQYNPQQYQQKKLLTQTEERYEAVIKKHIPQGYTLQPQVCLASIIQKNYDNKYINELFRIIDFGVFDQYRKIVCLIEINDITHARQDRADRDKKVKELCRTAGIPLITFWTHNGINETYIQQRLQEYCE